MSSGLCCDLAHFGLSLIKMSDGDGRDICISPSIISLATGMILGGAKDQTADQLKTNVFPNVGKAADIALELLIDQLFKQDIGDIQMNTGNRLYLPKKIPVEGEFFRLCKLGYSSDVKNCHLKYPEAVRNAINDWMSDMTVGKVKEILTERSINGQTAAILVNGIYFKGAWKFEFDPQRTGPRPFHIAPHRETLVETMELYQRASLTYGVSKKFGCKVLGLPYSGDKLVFYLLLPKEPFGLKSLLTHMCGASLLSTIRAVPKNVRVTVYLPKMKLRCGGDLTGLFRRQGVVDLFSQEKANLTGVSPQPLWVSRFQHQTCLELDEEGSVAAPTPTSPKAKRGFPAAPRRVPVVRADHPFLYAIVHEDTDAILFLGTTTFNTNA